MLQKDVARAMCDRLTSGKVRSLQVKSRNVFIRNTLCVTFLEDNRGRPRLANGFYYMT